MERGQFSSVQNSIYALRLFFAECVLSSVLSFHSKGSFLLKHVLSSVVGFHSKGWRCDRILLKRVLSSVVGFHSKGWRQGRCSQC